MSLPPTSDPESEALQFILRWIELIAAENWTEALSLIDLPSRYGQTWTRAQIEARLAEYRPAGARLTSPATATGYCHTSTGRFDDRSGFYLDCDLPLNDTWSDLSAQFEFLEVNGQYSVALQDIHVL
jgi:hypothetical protein